MAVVFLLATGGRAKTSADENMDLPKLDLQRVQILDGFFLRKVHKQGKGAYSGEGHGSRVLLESRNLSTRRQIFIPCQLHGSGVIHHYLQHNGLLKLTSLRSRWRLNFGMACRAQPRQGGIVANKRRGKLSLSQQRKRRSVGESCHHWEVPETLQESLGPSGSEVPGQRKPQKPVSCRRRDPQQIFEQNLKNRLGKDLAPYRIGKHSNPQNREKIRQTYSKNTIFGIFCVFLPYFACGGVFLFCTGPSLFLSMSLSSYSSDVFSGFRSESLRRHTDRLCFSFWLKNRTQSPTCLPQQCPE